MKELWETLLKTLILEFTWRKLVFILIGVFVVAVGFFTYERYTSSFRFSRLQKATELVARLQELQAHPTNSTPDLDRARQDIITQAIQAIEEKPLTLEFIPTKLTLRRDDLWKFLAASAYLWLIALFQLPKCGTKEGRSALSGLIVSSVINGLVGIFVPAIWWPWFHLFIFPFTWIALLVPIALWLALISALRNARRKAQSIACTNNLKRFGISARMWADAHKGILPHGLSSIEEILKDERAIHCPSSKAAIYQIVSPGVVQSEVCAVYARCSVHGKELLVDGSVRQCDHTCRKGPGKFRVDSAERCST